MKAKELKEIILEGENSRVEFKRKVRSTVKVAKELGPGKRVVTILCDTGERYFSMEQYFEA